MNDINWKISVLATLSLFGILGICFLTTVLIFKHTVLMITSIVSMQILGVFLVIYKRRKKLKS